MTKRLNHVGISVSNLERSIAFYRDIFGMRVLVHGPFAGERYDSILRLKGARGHVAFLASTSGDLQLELFEFERPVPKPAAPDRSVCDHGITHFCIQVEDLESEYARLKAAGVVFHCPPTPFSATDKATYGRDPDGNVFELIEISADG